MKASGSVTFMHEILLSIGSIIEISFGSWLVLNDDWSKKIKVANYVYVTQVMNAYYIRVSGLV